jgi:ferredoxin-NADP reductase
MIKSFDTKIIEIETIAKGTTQITIEVPKNFTFKPGEYVTLVLPALKHLPTVEQFRDMSIASSSDHDGYIKVAFRNGESPFKQTIQKIGVGLDINLQGPKGLYGAPSGQNVVAVAGGIGITPFYSALVSGVKFPVLYYNSQLDSSAYLEDLQQILGNQLTTYFERPSINHLKMFENVEEIKWFIAGPPGFVSTVRSLLITLMVSDTMIRTEVFTGYAKEQSNL